MREFYKDFYGCVASVNWDDRFGTGYTLVILSSRPSRKVICHKTYSTKRGARIAMGKLSDGWHKVDEWS